MGAIDSIRRDADSLDVGRFSGLAQWSAHLQRIRVAEMRARLVGESRDLPPGGILEPLRKTTDHWRWV